MSFFFLPSPFPLSFFRPSSYRKGYYFYSPQSSTVIKSKMAATTILRTRTRFRPPKIRLQCRLLSIWTAATLFSSLMFACYFSSLLAKYNLIKVLKCSCLEVFSLYGNFRLSLSYILNTTDNFIFVMLPLF